MNDIIILLSNITLVNVLYYTVCYLYGYVFSSELRNAIFIFIILLFYSCANLIWKIPEVDYWLIGIGLGVGTKQIRLRNHVLEIYR